MQELHSGGRIEFRPGGKVPRLKRYLDEAKGMPVGSVWNDIRPLINFGQEAVGYPTQKPVALLERIIRTSSNPDDIVLDAFCGCGTALVAAQQLGRRWVGIDVSPTACRVMSERLTKVCKLREGRDFRVVGMPVEEAKLRKMPPFEFENWAVVSLGGIPNKTKVGDMGIDGRIYPVRAIPEKPKKGRQLTIMDDWYPIQVKQADKIERPDVDAFEAVMMREDRPKGFMVSFGFTDGAEREIDGFFRRTGRAIIPLTVREILDEEISRRLV